jgi:dATP pyrophosphohydrolase
VPRIVSEIVDVYIYRRTDAGPQFLMLRRAPNLRLGGSWQSVHGHIENEETAMQTALREMKEETSLTPVAFHQLETVNQFFVATEDAVHFCPCFAAEIAANADPTLNEEHDAFLWTDHEGAIRALPWPGQHAAVREIVTYLIPRSWQADVLRIPL